MEKQTIGKFIYLLIKRKGITINELANVLGVSRSFISNVIHERKRFPTNLVEPLKEYFELGEEDCYKIDRLTYGVKKEHKVNLAKVPSYNKASLISEIDSLVRVYTPSFKKKEEN